MTHRSK